MAAVFGKYLLQRKLAEGGMAEVFLARQSGVDGFEKPVVIKRILPHLSDEPAFVEMFQSEAKVAARLSHPSIVHIFDFGKVDGQYFIAMEFIHGEDLRNVAKAAERQAHRPSLALVARIIADVLGALHYAHTRSGPDGRRLGLVHRDISPQNVLVTYEGGVKLVDFGIAKATETQEGNKTQAGLLKGKYGYMSPEQCRGKPLDARSDVFAVGILLWELVTWKRLFRRETDLMTLVAVADEPIPQAASLRADIPAELDRICARALARPLEERYPSAQAMQADLESLIRRYGWEADSIRLQQYMREIFAEKLARQDEAIRAAGLGSFEDLLVRADEGTRLSWMDTDSGQHVRSGLELLGGPGDTHSTLQGAAGQQIPIAEAATLHGVPLPQPSPPRWRRAAVIIGTSTLVAAGGLGAVFWPSGEPAPAVERPAVEQLAAESKIHVSVDELAVISVDGVARPEPTREADLVVTAQVGHELRVRGASGREQSIHVKPLAPGAAFPVRVHLAPQ